MFSSICFEEIQGGANAFSIPEVRDFICSKFGFAAGLTMEEGTIYDYGVGEEDGMMMMGMVVRSLTLMQWYEPDGYWDFTGSMNENCNQHRSDVVVECMTSGPDCVQDGDQCTTDLDCCDHMFCSSISGNCTDPVEYTYLLALFRGDLALQLTTIFHVNLRAWC